MRSGKHLLAAIGVVVASGSAACTLLLDRDKEQCSTDGDCARFATGSVCRDTVCTDPASAIRDAGFGPDGCFAGTPTTNDELLNACTATPDDCLPFDNCAQIGACDGGLPPTSDPPGGTASATSDAGSPATALCTDLAAAAGARIVYATGSSNFPSFLTGFASVLAKNDPKYAVVWQTSSSCEGVDKVFNGTASLRTMKEKPGRVTQYYDETGTPTPCLLGGEVPVDIGESDTFASSCANRLGYSPANPVGTPIVGEYLGPIMAMVFAVPATSTKTALSAEAARAVFGNQSGTKVLGFDDPNQLFIRSDSTATNQIISRAIYVTPTKWWGVDKQTAANMASQLKQVPSQLAEKTIGTLSSDFADRERGNLTTLAFQARGQKCAYWTDTTRFAKDKKNVRDGHYAMWGPLHFFTRLQGNGPNEAAGAFALRFSVPQLDQALLQAVASTSTTPLCAMNVTRDEEMGPMRPYDPPYHCGCYFDSIVGGTGGSCTACAGPQDCPSSRPSCNYGFCETR